MGPIWVLSAPDEPYIGPMSLAIREVSRTRKSPVMAISFLLIFTHSKQYEKYIPGGDSEYPNN